jgi:hypothetical protein
MHPIIASTAYMDDRAPGGIIPTTLRRLAASRNAGAMLIRPDGTASYISCDRAESMHLERRAAAQPMSEASTVVPVRRGKHYDHTYASMEQARQRFLVAASAWLATHPHTQDVQDELAVTIDALRHMVVLLTEAPSV